MAAPLVAYRARGLYDEPPIAFENGVAAIDAITLVLAAQKVAEAAFEVALPQACEVAVPQTFKQLSKVTAKGSPAGGLSIVATVDTKKMLWDVPDGTARAGEFIDYDGQPRYGVKLSRLPVSLVDGLAVSRAEMRVEDGSGVYLWFAELPLDALAKTGLYELYSKIGQITRDFALSDTSQILDMVTVPALQLRYERQLLEIEDMNPGVIADARQRVVMALDETGARVQAVVHFRTGAPSFPTEPKEFHFGEKHPVAFWLTERRSQIAGQEPEPDSLTPFAVIVTTSDAWLDPDAAVSFDEGFSDASDGA